MTGSDQFSEKPLPANKRRCPHCGEVVPPTAKKCWLCREELSDRPEHVRKQVETTSLADTAAWAILGVIGLILFFGMMAEMPGVLLVVFAVLTPFVVRAFISTSKEPDRAIPESTTHEAPASTPSESARDDAPRSIRLESPEERNPILTILNAIAMIAGVAALSMSAFCSAFFVVCTGGVMGVGAVGGSETLCIVVFFLAVAAGVAAAVYAGVWALRTIKPRRN